MALNFLSNDDFYQVKLGSMLASYDRDILSLLYQPIIGHTALSLYFTLWSETKRFDFNDLSNHELLSKIMDIDLTSINEARKKLEGIGLLKTYKSKQGAKRIFIYELFAPNSPKEFFDDVIYKGLLAAKIGTKEVQKLALMFSTKEMDLSDYEDISLSFKDIYQIYEQESLKVLNVNSGRGRKTKKIKSTFEIGDFLKELENSASISQESLTSDDIEEISRLVTLFGLDILTMVDIVSSVFDAHNVNHLNYNDMYNLCIKYKDGDAIKETPSEFREYTENDKFGKMLNLMQNTSPYDYLSLKTGGTVPASEVAILNTLFTKYGLNNAVINALVDYTLIKCEGILSRSYIEKIAATLKRKNVTTALEACNALKGKPKTRKTTKVKENTEEETLNPDEVFARLEDI